MGLIKEPKGVDFFIQSPPLTEKGKKEISEVIQKREMEKKRLLKRPVFKNKTMKILITLIAFVCVTSCNDIHKKKELTNYPKPIKDSIVKTDPSAKFLKMADVAYKNNERKKAKQLYLKAAKMGNQDALNYTLDALLFRANSLTKANPELAYEVYKQAKKANPSLKLYDEKEAVETMKKCVEAGHFDAKSFIKKYHINEKNEKNSEYFIWELAEEASRGGRFGKPNPRLVLQLVSRGGSVPFELEDAVKKTYSNWKLNKIVEFKICDFISSGMGATYCANREEEIADKSLNKEISSLIFKRTEAIEKVEVSINRNSIK